LIVFRFAAKSGARAISTRLRPLDSSDHLVGAGKL
jgi:hypothetical protein